MPRSDQYVSFYLIHPKCTDHRSINRHVIVTKYTGCLVITYCDRHIAWPLPNFSEGLVYKAALPDSNELQLLLLLLWKLRAHSPLLYFIFILCVCSFGVFFVPFSHVRFFTSWSVSSMALLSEGEWEDTSNAGVDLEDADHFSSDDQGSSPSLRPTGKSSSLSRLSTALAHLKRTGGSTDRQTRGLITDLVGSTSRRASSSTSSSERQRAGAAFSSNSSGSVLSRANTEANRGLRRTTVTSPISNNRKTSKGKGKGKKAGRSVSIYSAMVAIIFMLIMMSI